LIERVDVSHTVESLRYADYPIIMLMDDAESLLAECGTRPDCHHILPRAAVSVLFAGIEGSVFVLKQMFHDVPELSAALTDEGMCLLREKTPGLNDQGVMVVRDTKIPLAANVRFLERIASRVLGTRLDIVRPSGRWDDFRRAIGVRHRVTHPRPTVDMGVSDEELDLMNRVFSMFVDFFGDIVAGLKALAEPAIPPQSLAKRGGGTPDAPRSCAPPTQSVPSSVHE